MGRGDKRPVYEAQASCGRIIHPTKLVLPSAGRLLFPDGAFIAPVSIVPANDAYYLLT